MIDIIDHRSLLSIIDISGYFFRAYYSLPSMTAPDGTPVNAVYGLCLMLGKMIKQSHNQFLAVALDAPGDVFRHKIYPNYKANRSPLPENLVPQFALMYEALQAFGLYTVECEGFEADDIIATLTNQAKQKGAIVRIVSSDKDMMQLIDKNQVYIWDPMKECILDEEATHKKFGVYPYQVADVQALAGDTSDNIPGVPQIGVKIAAKLINQFNNLDNLLDSTNQIKQIKRRKNLEEFAELARISKRLVSLSNAVPIKLNWQNLYYKSPRLDLLIAFFDRMGFNSLTHKIKEFVPENVFTNNIQIKSNVTNTHSNVNYYLVTELNTLKEFIYEAKKEAIVGFNIATDGCNYQAKLIGFSLALPNRQAVYVPLQHQSNVYSDKDLIQCPFNAAISLLGELLSDSSVLKIGQNIKYNAHIMARYDLNLVSIDDILLMSFVLEAGQYNNQRYDIQILAERYLGYKMITISDLINDNKVSRFIHLKPEQACKYAAAHADVIVRLQAILRNLLRKNRLLLVYETLERPLSLVLLAMEKRGITFNSNWLHRLDYRWQIKLKQIEEQIYSLCGRKFNISSTRQVGQILFDELQLPNKNKTATGQYATNYKILQGLLNQHPIIDLIITWRKIYKLKSTYTKNLLEAVNPETRRMHTTYVMTGTQTGRLSSRNPNLQNIPIHTEEGAKIRNCFTAQSGYKLLSMDYSQIELRLLAEFADVFNLKSFFAAGEDIHTMTANSIFHLSPSEINDEYRYHAKTVNFGIIYGMSAFGLAKQLSVTYCEAKKFIERYFEKFPEIRTYIDRQIIYAQKHGYVETLFKRRIYLPDINAHNASRRQHAERQAINAPLQGTAADIIKRAMIKIDRYIYQHPEIDNKVAMLLQIHDELIFEVVDNLDTNIIDNLKKLMEQATLPVYKNVVHLKIDISMNDHL